jgi:hypothetical protein
MLGQVKDKRTLGQKAYDFLYKDVYLISGLNSMILISLFVIFLALFIKGLQLHLLKTYFEILISFGMMIVLFCVVPTYFKGFFVITNTLLLIGGLVWIVNNDGSMLLWAMRLNVIFLCVWLLVMIINLVRKKRSTK